MFFVPFAGSSLSLGNQRVLFLPGKGQHLFNVLLFLDESHQVFLRAKSGWTFRWLSGRKRSIYPVIIAGRDRVKLVIMALRTTQCRRKKSLAHVVNQVIQVNLASDRLRNHRCTPGASSQKSGSHNCLRIVGSQFITCNLLEHELVVRLVIVEGANHEITITPEIRKLVVIRKPCRVSIANNIQPVLAPTFPVMRAFQ